MGLEDHVEGILDKAPQFFAHATSNKDGKGYYVILQDYADKKKKTVKVMHLYHMGRTKAPSIGSLVFSENRNDLELKFVSMQSDMRGKKLSHILMDSFAEYAGVGKHVPLAKTPRVDDPAGAFLLSQYGFVPSGGGKNVDLYKRTTEGQSRIKFPAWLVSGMRGRQFEEDMVQIGSEQYRIVKDTKEDPIARVKIETKYTGFDSDVLESRRRKNGNLFDIKYFERPS